MGEVGVADQDVVRIGTGRPGESTISQETPESDRWEKLDALSRMGILQVDQKGRWVCDTNRVKAFSLEEFCQTLGRQAPEYSGSPFIALMDIFRDQKVYSREDYQKLVENNQEVQPKYPLYFPRNANAALSPNALKDDFYLGPWEMQNPRLTDKYPLRSAVKGSVSTWEAIATCLIYHPRYGAGERDETSGKLMVQYPGEETKRPISQSFFTDGHHYFGTPGRQRINIQGSPGLWVAKRCQRMTKRGLLYPEDFKIQASYQAEAQLGINPRPLNKKGLVMVDRVRYGFSVREFPADTIHMAHKLSDTLGGVVRQESDGSLTLMRVFQLIDITESPVTYRGNGNRGYGYARSGSYSSWNRDEWEKQFGSTVVFDNFQESLAFTALVSKEASIHIGAMSIRDQEVFQDVFSLMGKDQMLPFIKKYGLEGVRAYVLLERGHESGATLLEMDKNKKLLTPLLNELASIHLATSYPLDLERSHVPEHLRDQMSDVQQVIFEHTSKLFLAASPFFRGEQPGYVIGDVQKALQDFRIRVEAMHEEYFGQARDRNGQYRSLLASLDQVENNPEQRTLVLSRIVQTWMEDMGEEIQHVDKILDQIHATDSFYQNNIDLYETADTTTGDTPEERKRLADFLQKYGITGRVLDAGCGDPADRLTGFIADELQGKGEVVGVDRQEPHISQKRDNLHLMAGDITDLPYSNGFFDACTANWSVLNEWKSRSVQQRGFSEMARVLKPGGHFFFDVPHLEGGEGSWMDQAKLHHEQYPDDHFGMITAEFPGGRVGSFFIYPEAELKAQLEANGFSIQDIQYWRTQAGKPRMAIIARMDRKITPYIL